MDASMLFTKHLNAHVDSIQLVLLRITDPMSDNRAIQTIANCIEKCYSK